MNNSELQACMGSRKEAHLQHRLSMMGKEREQDEQDKGEGDGLPTQHEGKNRRKSWNSRAGRTNKGRLNQIVSLASSLTAGSGWIVRLACEGNASPPRISSNTDWPEGFTTDF
ncbi:uncharacterized protein MCYG_07876 [Microsporum canis CBS 113480]|uniref:Uncharacterized protein n=1 Tax=Arthroderma otae (strain ATCC MYA-4605 / CBS 113480) TaxID=554155 RepID=C5FXL7_ARTOC|nr:uncharacterized protein MCYG_07876 [Microsporum canis CBS 113480]EEQ35057.1 predicted protein [Microsporum canis CBS 113480]